MAGGAGSGEITRVVDVLSAVDPGALTADELTDHCLAATVLVNAALAHAAVLAAEFQQRGAWVEDGATSGATWLANRTGERRAEVAGRAKIGIGLRQVPAVASAARQGEITFDHARRIVDCVRRSPALAARDDEVLLEQARTLDADLFRHIARHWQALAEDDAHTPNSSGPADVEPVRRESFYLSQIADGWYVGDCTFSPETGAAVSALFDEHVDRAMRAQRDGDPSLERMAASELRAQALADLVAQHQRREPSDASVPDRYRVAVVLHAAGDAG